MAGAAGRRARVSTGEAGLCTESAGCVDRSTRTVPKNKVMSAGAVTTGREGVSATRARGVERTGLDG